MNSRTNQNKENTAKSVSAARPQKQSDSESAFQFTDNRSEAIAQKKLFEMANSSARTSEATQMQAMVDHHSVQRQLIQNKEQHLPPPQLGSSDQPIQLMTFKRFRWKQNPLSWGWKYNATEKNLLATEKRLTQALDELKPFTNGILGADIFHLAGKFHFINAGDYEEAEYATVLEKMTNLMQPVNELKEQVLSANLGNSHLKKSLTTTTGQGAIAKEVMIELLKVYTALPAVMNTAKNKDLIAEAIYPDMEAASGIYNEDMGASTAKFAKTRGALLTKNFKQLHVRIVSTWNSIKQSFSIDGDLKEIELTGSDFHNEGQQVAIIESTTGKKIVYKPRSISPDAHLTAEGGSAFDDLNKVSKGKVQLPTMKMAEAEDQDGTFSLVEFQEKVEEMSVAEVQNYYERFGEMVVASKLMGVNDLHNENIMSLLGTPTIIDAETAFLPFIMEAESYAKTEIGMSLSSVTKHFIGGKAENFFYTPQEKTAYDESVDGDFADYIATLRKDDLNGQKNYITQFDKGLDNVINLVKFNFSPIVEILLARMKMVKRVRVVPFGTKDFGDSMRDYRRALAANEPLVADTIIGKGVTKMKDAIKLKGFSITNSDWAATVTSKVGKSLKADYEAQDTPILHFEPGINELHYHGIYVGASANWEDAEDFIKRMVSRIGTAKPAKIKADLNVGN